MCSLALLDVHQDSFAVESHRVAAQACAYRVHPATGPRIELPLMRGTGQDAVSQNAFRDGIRQVRAPVLVGDQRPVEVAQQDVDGSEVHGAHLAFPDVVQRPGVPPRRCHRRSTLKMSPFPSPAALMVAAGSRMSPASLWTVRGPSLLRGV